MDDGRHHFWSKVYYRVWGLGNWSPYGQIDEEAGTCLQAVWNGTSEARDPFETDKQGVCSLPAAGWSN